MCVSAAAEAQALQQSKASGTAVGTKRSATKQLRRTSGMARRYSPSASKDVKSAMRRRKRGTLKSGGSGKTVRSKKQAIAIGLSEARKKGKKVPRKRKSN
jgi:hypothetical protein